MVTDAIRKATDQYGLPRMISVANPASSPCMCDLGISHNYHFKRVIQIPPRKPHFVQNGSYVVRASSVQTACVISFKDKDSLTWYPRS